MKTQSKHPGRHLSQPDDLAPRHSDYIVWRVMKGQQDYHDKQIRRAYNKRAQMPVQTKH